MNVDKVNELADFIEQAKYKFDMANPHTNTQCGTAGCIGGHAAVLWPEAEDIGYDRKGFKAGVIAKILDLRIEMVDLLCYPLTDGWPQHTYSIVTREIAVTALRHLAKTGEVKFF